MTIFYLIFSKQQLTIHYNSLSSCAQSHLTPLQVNITMRAARAHLGSPKYVHNDDALL